jgi:collagen type XII alpha
MKAFAKGIVSQFQVGPDAAHFGIIDFSSSVVNVLPLSDDPAAIDIALDTMPFLSFGTDTTDGLIQAQREIQLHGRPTVNHAILLLTDGRADDGPSAVSAAAGAKTAGTTIFSIGVTSLIDLTQLQQIASNPSDTHVFNVSTFDALTGILAQLVTNICPQSVPVPATADLAVTKTGSPNPVVAGAKLTYLLTVRNNGPATATDVALTDQLPPEVSLVTVTPSQGSYQEQNGVLTCNLGTLTNGASATVTVVRPAEPGLSTTGCEGAIDLMFVIDTSGSVAISAGAFDKIKTFAKTVVAKFNLSAIGPHLGIVDFSSPADTRLVLGLSDDAPTVNNAIDTMPLFGNGTDIVSGLATAKTEIDQHGRPGVNHAIILLTDGRADDGSNPETKAAEIKAAGIQIFSIGVTDLIDLSQLRQIASSPVETHLFTVDDYSGLSAILDQLIINVCPPALETTICNTVNVQATEPDPALDNNGASACTVVKSHALLRLTAAPSPGHNVLITWPAWASNFVLQNAANGVTPPQWNPLTAPPSITGDRAAVIQDLDPAMRIYRLVEP